jgi:polyadenylate-binding protein 2
MSAEETAAAVEELAEEGPAIVDEELEAMKSKVKEMEDEAEKLRKIMGESEEQLDGAEGGGEENAETDGRSIYVGNVDYSATPEELQELFASCGTVNRITILCDKFRNPKGYAYIEFAEMEAIDAAVALSETEFKGRAVKVVAKRTNQPGMGRGRGRGRGRGGGKGGKGGKGKGKGWGKGYGPAWRPRGGKGYRPY